MDQVVANPSRLTKIKTLLVLLNLKGKHIKVVEKQQDLLTGIIIWLFIIWRRVLSTRFWIALDRSSSSFDSTSVIKSQSSLIGQSSTETNPDNDAYFVKDGESKPVSFAFSQFIEHNIWISCIFIQLISSSVSLDTATSMIENGTQCSLPLSKQKRMRTLMRQERVTRKEADKDASFGVESERASPITHTSQAIIARYFWTSLTIKALKQGFLYHLYKDHQKETLKMKLLN